MMNWTKLLGWYDFVTERSNEPVFENRLLNVFCSLGTAFYLLGTIENFISGLDYRLCLTTLAGTIGYGLCFYFGRFKKKHRKAVPFFILLSFGLCISGWFFNGGSMGPFAMIVIFYMLIFVTMTKWYWHFIITGFCIVISLSLYYVEYYYPWLITGYATNQLRLYDMAFTSCIVLVFAFIIVRALKDSYDKEIINSREQNKLIREQNEKLEQRNLLRTRLLSVMSHDLRSPLTSIITLMEAFKDDTISTDELKTYSIEMQDRVRYNLSLLDNLVIWTRNQLYGFTVKVMDYDVDSLAEECILIFQPIAKRKNISLNIQIPKRIKVVCDVEMIKAVFRNLVSNAIKFTNPNGMVSINASESESGFVKVSVSDNGVGIKPELLQSLFTDKAFTTKGTMNEIGSGLGLLMCKDFVEQNGGTISAESKEGIGSVFSFTIPAG